MPRTVPKIVAKAERAANKKTTNKEARFMESRPRQKDSSHGMQAPARVDQRTCGRRRRVKKPRKRSEGEEREARWNEGNPRVLRIRSANGSLGAARLRRVEEARQRSE